MSKLAHLTGWEKFHLGRWVKTPPTKPGFYLVADRNGDLKGVCTVEAEPSFGKLYGMIPGRTVAPVQEVWRAWWWSEPISAMPTPPDWEQE